MTETLSSEVGVRVVHENPIASRAAKALAEYLEASSDSESRTPLPHQSERRTPLPHQKVILEDVLRGLGDGMHKGFVESPTATGKTYLMGRLAEAFYNAGYRVLLLCDRKQQADQILGKVGDTGLIQVTEAMDFRDIGVHYDNNHASANDKVVVSTYAGLNNFSQTGELGQFDVFLCDEAHKTLGLVTKANLVNFCPDAVKVGFTATSIYSWDKKVSQIFESPFHSTGLKEAIEGDLVAPLNCLIYATEDEIPYFDAGVEYSQKELEKLIALKPRNDKAIEFAKDFIKNGRQGIIACVAGANLAHARLLASELDGDIIKLEDGRLKFVRAKSVGGHQSTAENRKILQQFENGHVDVLTFVDLITEGWNSQVASFLIDLQPTTSLVKKTQKIGRVIRKKPNNLVSIVVDFMDISSKRQVTALDVLQERQFMLGHTFKPSSSSNGGGGGGGGGSNYDRNYIERIINSNLWYELQQIHMFKVAELRLRTSADEPSMRDPIFAKYEQLLGKRLEREPGNSMGVPETVIKEIGAFVRRYTRVERAIPDAEDIEAYIVEKMPAHYERAAMLAQLALQGFDAEASGLIEADKRVAEEYTLDEEVEINHLYEVVDKALDALPEREKRILQLRFGLDGGKTWTFEAIGHELDLTRERVRQLEGQALSRLGVLREIAYVSNYI